VRLPSRLTAPSLVGVLATLGVLGGLGATLASTHDARAALDQVWSPFVLVTGLLLVGLVADADGLFARLGERLARIATSGVWFFGAVTIITGVVTALLNLDTAVCFLTPVLVYAARQRGAGEAPVLYGVLMMANAGSLFLPGSNLTNLIVLGPLHLTGAGFLARMWLPAVAALGVTALIVVLVERRDVVTVDLPSTPVEHPVRPLGAVAVAACTVAVLALRSPALAVLGIGVTAVGARLATGEVSVRLVRATLGLATLVGLFGLAVTFGTLGRVLAPSSRFFHLGSLPTAGVAVLATAVINNLPAAALLAAHRVSHPFALLVGLNLGPNLAVTGSLAWLIWLRAARSAGAAPSLARASRIGVLAVPASVVAALGALALTGHG
jgi:arsenical pump membrane protein